MKKLLYLFFLLILNFTLKAQYLITQNLGSDSTLIRIGPTYNGAIKGGLINMAFNDTTDANLSRISFYTGAQIWTNGDSSLWVRKKSIYGSYWFKVSGSGAGPSGSGWQVSATGQMFPITVPYRGLGTDATYGGAVGLVTNGVVRAIVPNAGFSNIGTDTTSNKIFTWNPSTKDWGYANWNNGGSGSTAISALTAASATNDINNADYGQIWRWNTLSSGVGLTLSTSSTASTDAGHTLFGIDMQGANANSNQTTYAASFANSHTGTSSTNIGILLQAFGGTNNYALDLGVAGSNTGRMRLNGATSGSIVIQPASAAGTYTLTLPTTDGNSGEFLQTNGSGVLTWAEGGSSMKVRRSIEIVSDSAQLVNDSASFASGAVKVYGYDVTRGWKDAAKLVLTNPQAKDGLYYDSGDWVNISALNKRVQFEIGVTTNAPAAGDSVLANTNFPGKDIKVYRDGLRQYEGTTDGVEFVGGDSIIFHPPFTANERVIIETLDTALWSTITLEPIPVWSNLTFTTKTAGMTSTDSTWSFSGSAWDQYGLADQYLEANTDGMIRFKYQATAGQYQSIGFKLAATNGSYTTMKWGAMINPNTLYRVVDGAITNQGYNASTGDYIVIRRTGSTIYLQTTTDNITYTTRHTFSETSSARLYIVYNVYAGQTGYYPKGFNVSQ